MHQRHKLLGFSLFEVILVMLVIAVLVAAFITFKGRRAQEDAAERLGYRLYEYGMAVSEYVRLNPDGYSPDNEPEEIFGYEWLQETTNPQTNEPFLNKHFSLDFLQLRIANVEDGDAVIKTVLNIDQTGQGDFDLVVDLIELGVVSIAVTAGERDENAPSGVIYRPDPSLAGRAAHYASNYRDDDGPAMIAYRLAGDFSDTPNELYIVGEPKLELSLAEHWLQTDGGNYMQGPIQFNRNLPETTRRIKGLNKLEFADAQGDTRTTVRGFKVSGLSGMSHNENNDEQLFITHYENGEAIELTINDSLCFMARMQRPTGSTDNCVVRRSANDDRWELVMTRTSGTNDNFSCEVRCLMYDW
jgi:type II secretory pathway pseudopilin PulG